MQRTHMGEAERPNTIRSTPETGLTHEHAIRRMLCVAFPLPE
eukprot:CAMPEP_0119388842 /NCGR_PEP_ID=MMETSP1334-20130426/106732_1 /TAXON_ID=127549 /ORGANISM="Calcidiscus leptoporus, Strain RCC1130" /LENGTH=41 /DNA_ID= /DNA_START= /DNA_END= /DNA_ORIENTATION=